MRAGSRKGKPASPPAAREVACKNERREIRFEDVDEGMVLKHSTKEAAANEEGRLGLAFLRRQSKTIPGIPGMVALDLTPIGSQVLNSLRACHGLFLYNL